MRIQAIFYIQIPDFGRGFLQDQSMKTTKNGVLLSFELTPWPQFSISDFQNLYIVRRLYDKEYIKNPFLQRQWNFNSNFDVSTGAAEAA